MAAIKHMVRPGKSGGCYACESPCSHEAAASHEPKPLGSPGRSTACGPPDATTRRSGHPHDARGHHQLAETEVFRQFQYLTVPLFVTLDMMRQAISKATPAIGVPVTEDKLQALYSLR